MFFFCFSTGREKDSLPATNYHHPTPPHISYDINIYNLNYKINMKVKIEFVRLPNT